MPKSVTVTVTLSFPAGVPQSWKGDDLQSKVSDALLIDVKAVGKRVVIGDVEIEEITVEDEEE